MDYESLSLMCKLDLLFIVDADKSFLAKVSTSYTLTFSLSLNDFFEILLLRTTQSVGTSACFQPFLKCFAKCSLGHEIVVESQV